MNGGACIDEKRDTACLCLAHREQPRFRIESNFDITDYKHANYQQNREQWARQEWTYSARMEQNVVVLTLVSGQHSISFYISNFEAVDGGEGECYLTFYQPQENNLRREDQRYMAIDLDNTNRLQIVYEYGPVSHNLFFKLSEGQFEITSVFEDLSRYSISK